MWADALDRMVHRKRLVQVQRGRLWLVASAYRTVSESAMTVIAGVLPVFLLAEERKAVYSCKGGFTSFKKSRNVRGYVPTTW